MSAGELKLTPFELGETATSLAKGLSLTQSGVSKAVLRGEKIVKEGDLKLL